MQTQELQKKVSELTDLHRHIHFDNELLQWHNNKLRKKNDKWISKTGQFTTIVDKLSQKSVNYKHKFKVVKAIIQWCFCYYYPFCHLLLHEHMQPNLYGGDVGAQNYLFFATRSYTILPPYNFPTSFLYHIT